MTHDWKRCLLPNPKSGQNWCPKIKFYPRGTLRFNFCTKKRSRLTDCKGDTGHKKRVSNVFSVGYLETRGFSTLGSRKPEATDLVCPKPTEQQPIISAASKSIMLPNAQLLHEMEKCRQRGEIFYRLPKSSRDTSSADWFYNKTKITWFNVCLSMKL